MKFTSYISAVLLAAVPLSAMANEEVVAEEVAAPAIEETVAYDSHWYDGVQFGIGVSATSGLNGFVGYANKESDNWLMRRLGLRLDFASTKPLSSLIDSAIDSVIGDDGYEIDEITINEVGIDAKHIGAIVDFYPFGDTWALGGWRISGGYFKGNLNVSADLTGNIDGLPAGEYGFSFGGTDYKYVGSDVRGTAEVDWDYSGPYVGTGFDIGLFAGFKIYVDAGVVFADAPAKIDVNIPFENLQQSKDGGQNWTSINTPELEATVDAEIAEVLSDAQSELDKLDFYPMIKVGFMYRF